jgi:hypothetical protein
MIQLANDPHASRSFERAAAASGDAKAATAEARRARSGHAWPFPSRYAARPVREENTHKPAAQDSGS